MPKRFSSAAIGMFVVGGIVLAVAALAVLGSGNLFKRPHRFICFFQGSLNGLKVGAAVKVRGVEIGSVSAIRLLPEPSEGKLKAGNRSLSGLPVIIDIDESQLLARGATGQALKTNELEWLIKRGLRAQLGTESLLTGLLYIDLDLHPGTPLNLLLVPGTGEYREIPTIPTDLQQIQETAMKALAKFEKVDVVALTQSITDAGNAATNLLNSRDVRNTLVALETTTKNLNVTISSIRGFVENVDSRADPMLASLKKASDQANVALIQIGSAATQMRTATAQLQTTLAPDAPLAYRLDVALQNFAEAASAMREFTDYLQRNPSAIVRGRYARPSAQ
jgi:paraquat-inducible protein B